MNNITIAIIGIGFIFLMTILGSAIIFLFKKTLSDKVHSMFLGFASGIMIAASIWSLILPSIEQSEHFGKFSFVPSAVGILAGAIFLVVMDKFLPFLINRKKNKFQMTKSSRLFLAVTLHNIPEGLAVGLAFGNAFLIGETSAFYVALSFAFGIGIQNLPEGSAVSLPMQQELGNKKAFLYGVISGVVEPVMAVIGILLSTYLSHLMPWFLSFSAGAMLFVIAEELLPESKMRHQSTIGTWGFVLGFIVMMILDVALS